MILGSYNTITADTVLYTVTQIGDQLPCQTYLASLALHTMHLLPNQGWASLAACNSETARVLFWSNGTARVVWAGTRLLQQAKFVKSNFIF